MKEAATQVEGGGGGRPGSHSEHCRPANSTKAQTVEPTLESKAGPAHLPSSLLSRTRPAPKPDLESGLSWGPPTPSPRCFPVTKVAGEQLSRSLRQGKSCPAASSSPRTHSEPGTQETLETGVMSPCGEGRMERPSCPLEEGRCCPKVLCTWPKHYSTSCRKKPAQPGHWARL